MFVSSMNKRVICRWPDALSVTDSRHFLYVAIGMYALCSAQSSLFANLSPNVMKVTFFDLAGGSALAD